MECKHVASVMKIDTTDSYRMDKYSLAALLEKKSDGEIDCNYISQRAPFQWEPVQINKFYTRILNNQPIPEIIICETIEAGEKVSYLIDGLQRLSYAEWFRENRIKIGAKGVEFSRIKYRRYELDADGDKVFDDKGRARYEIDTVDVTGMYYRDLPEFLQRRFDNFNINVTTFFNCTEEMINYHIRNYNNHVGMTKSQYGITNINNYTSRNIKLIAEEHAFFKDIVKCTAKNKTKGVLDELVTRSLMTLYFLNDWKKELLDALVFVDTHATNEQFKHFRTLLDRLYAADCESVRDMFTPTNAHIWFAVFDRFIRLSYADTVFLDFMYRFQEALEKMKESKESSFMDMDAYKMFMSRNTKDKTTVQNKITCVYRLLMDYLHMHGGDKRTEQKTADKEDISAFEFVRENVKSDVSEEDMDDYYAMLDQYKIDRRSPLLEWQNEPSMLAIVAYSFIRDIDLDDWICTFFQKHTSYISDQQQNYMYMRKDLSRYLGTKKELITGLGPVTSTLPM